MRLLSTSLAFLGSALVLLAPSACTPEKDGAQAEVPLVEAVAPGEVCERLPPRPRSSTLLLDQTSYRCRIVAVPTGVELLPSPDGSRPDAAVSGGRIGDQIAADERGRFFTGARWLPLVLVWDGGGGFVRTLGREGTGPGEFSRSPAAIFVGPGDSLHVQEANRWHVFDPDLNFVRTFQSPARAHRSTSHVTEDGRIVFSGPASPSENEAVLHSTDAEGGDLRPVGPRVGATRAAQGGEGRFGRSAYRDGSLWIAPAAGSGTGFVLELRSTAGELRQTLLRNTPWLPLGGYPEPELQGIAPDFKHLNWDSEGLLWVWVAVKDPRYAPLRPGESPDAREAEQADLRLEVIDPDAGEVMAAVRFDTLSEAHPPPIFPVGRGTRRTFGYGLDSLGFVTVRFYTLQLVRSER